MQHLILKNNLSENKLNALLVFLRNWDIEAELVTKQKIKHKESSEFTLNVGLWSDTEISAEKLRNEVWKIQK